MVVDDFHLVGVAVTPTKANPPLIVDADAVLTFPISTQCFQTVAGWDTQVSEPSRAV